MASFTTNPTDSLAKCLFPVPKTVCSAGHKILVSNERNASTRKLNSDFIELKFRLLLSHLRLHMLLNLQEKKVVTILHWSNGALVPVQGSGLLLQNRGKEEYG